MATTTVTASKDASALKEGDGWSGFDNHHPIGVSASGFTYCSFVYFPLSFTGWTGITSATLNLRAHRAGSGNHVLGASSGVSRSVFIRRMTSDWGEGTDRGETLWSSAEPWGWNNRRNAFSTVMAPALTLSGYTDGTWYSVDITNIVQEWFNGSANYGLLLAGDEADPNKAIEFYARDAGSGFKPYLDITYTTNTAPTTPTGLSPTGNALVNSLNPTLTGTHNDPDGDNISAYQILFYQDDGTTLVWDSGTVSIRQLYDAGGHPLTQTTFSRSYDGPALTGNNFYKWKVRTRDPSSAWSPYSSLQRFKVNTAPNPPTIKLTDAPTSDLLTLTPTFNITHDDDDPGDSAMYGYRVVVTQSSNGSTIWDSGEIDTSASPVTTKTFTYSGPALSWGTAYTWKARTKDSNGVIGAYATASFNTHLTQSPINVDPGSGETISGIVPVFYAERGSTADTIVSYQILLKDASGASTIWDSGVLSTGITAGSSLQKTYTGTTLAYGTQYQWQIRVTGSIGGTSPYTPAVPFFTAADATVPTQSITPVTNGRVTSLTPTLIGTRGTTFTNYQIELYPSTAVTGNLGTPIWDSTNLSQTAATSVNKVYNGPALAWNTTYKWRIRVGSPALGSYTGLATFTTDAAGTPTLTAPANNAWITTLTPTFTGSSSGGESITAVRIRVYDALGTTLIWDSGDLSQTSATTFSKPYAGPALTGGVNYLWEARYTKSTGPTGPYSTRFTFHPNAAPNIPISLEPTPGYANAGNLTPTFKATFDDPDKSSMGDVPTSWVIEIRNNATDALIQTKTLTTGLTGNINTYVWGTNTGGADTALAYNVVYKWRTWFVDSKSATGAASSYQTFSNAQPPTIGVTSPSNGSNVGTTKPTITWSYSDPASSAQLKYRVQIIRVANGTVVYDSGIKVSGTSSHSMPTGYLQFNGESYTVSVVAYNQGSVPSNTATSTVTLTLAAPPAIAGLSATVYEDESRIVLDWDKSSLAANFVTYVIYRREIGDSDWTMIGLRKPETSTIFSDWYAGQRVTYQYRVTVVKLISNEPDLESPDSDIVTARLESDVWFVVGKDRATEHLFELPVSDESHTRPVQQEEFEPIGSNRKAVVRGFVLGNEGSVEVNFEESELGPARDAIDYLLFEAGPHILKNPFGDVYAATFGSPDYKYLGGGHMNVQLTWIETGNTNNPGLTPDEYLASIGAE